MSVRSIGSRVVQGVQGVQGVPVVLEARRVMDDLEAHGIRRQIRPSRATMQKDGVQPSVWDLAFFPGNTDILEIDLDQFRQGVLSPGPFPGLGGSPTGPQQNRSYIIIGMKLHYGDEDDLVRRAAAGDLGLQICEEDPDCTPVVRLPEPENHRSEALMKASRCVVGLVALLRCSVPGFWRRKWSRFDLQDFMDDKYKLSMDAVLYLTGVLKWCQIVQAGGFLHDSYLAFVWA